MPSRRLPALVLATALIVSVLSVVGAGSAASASSPAATPAATADSARAAARLNYVIPGGSYFSFPNRGKAAKYAIRNRILATIRSTVGGPRTANGLPGPTNGTIRIATWSFKDWAIAKALVAARNRGVSVQIVGARSRNAPNPQWRYLKRTFGSRLARPGQPATVDKVSFARDCRGSCRGRGGTPHAKYLLFTNVANSHVPFTTIQTSMNLTQMGYSGQWNQAEVTHREDVYQHFMTIFKEARLGVPVSNPHRFYGTVDGMYKSEFYPFPGASRTTDPVMRELNKVGCSNGGSRTQIRIIQYSIYGDRGVYIAKKLRSLWNAGCNVKVIYALGTRPVMSILRNGSGRGAIPVRQSVITGAGRVITKYNHSKWMTIVGRYAGANGQYITMSGSSNWSRFALSGDEQQQIIDNRGQALRHNRFFNITWAQKSSHLPGFGIKGQEGRMTESARLASIPMEITWGKGIYKYMSPNGG
ncbi:MAG: phospholipase D-like domain-containing protein [Marmoricola sp.]